MVVVWGRGHGHSIACQFHRRGKLWELASRGGRLWIDNEPQRELEHEPLRRIERQMQQLMTDETVHGRRAAEYEEQWSKRPDRFERIGGPVVNVVEERAISGRMLQQRLSLRRQWMHLARRPITRFTGRSISCAAMTPATAFFPAAWLVHFLAVRRLRSRRRRRNLCICCGYDLRASTSRCPECGSAVRGPPG